MMFDETSSAAGAALLAALLLALAAPARAAHPLVTDDTGTQGSGRWQLELNTDHARIRDAGNSAWEREANASLTRGLSETLDVAVNLPWARLGSAVGPGRSGPADATLLAKWRFHDDGRGWTLGLRPEVTLPTGNEAKGLGNGRATASLTLLSDYRSGAWGWIANAGYAYNDNSVGDRRHLWAASTAILYELGEQWTLAADMGASRAAVAGARTARFGLVGVIWHIAAAVDLDAGWRRNLGAGSRAHALGAGLTLRW